MTTATATETPALFLRIGETFYGVQAVAQRVVPVSWRLIKLGPDMAPEGSVYDVHADRFGLHCDCGDAVHRHQNKPTTCKHCTALLKAGLIGHCSMFEPP